LEEKKIEISHRMKQQADLNKQKRKFKTSVGFIKVALNQGISRQSKDLKSDFFPFQLDLITCK